MASLYVTAIGYLVRQGGAAETYEQLKLFGYLSDSALSNRAAVIALIEQAGTAFARSIPGFTGYHTTSI